MKRSKMIALLASTLALPTFTYAEDSNDDNEDPLEPIVELSLDYEILENYKLDDNDVLSRTRAHLRSLELDYKQPFELNDYWAGFVTITARVQNDDNDGDEPTKENTIELDELWLNRKIASTTNVWAGRRLIEDQHTWWWDESLLGFGVSFDNDRYQSSLTTAISSNPWSSANTPFEPEAESLLMILGFHQIQLNDQSSLTSIVHYQSDLSGDYQIGQSETEPRFDESDDTLTWLGLRYERDLSAPSTGDLSLRVDAAWMNGKSVNYELEESDNSSDGPQEISDKSTTSVFGWGVSSWINWQPPFLSGTQLHWGYAYGSGTDNSRTGGSRTFRQTGLQSNESDIAYYGHLTQPELSNLHIASLLISQNVFSTGQIYGQLNSYRLASIYDDTLEWDIDLEIQNNSHDLGHEASLGYEHEFNNGLSTQIRIARFYPGDAFGPLNTKPLSYYLINFSYEY